jgi:hypothetical protein
MSSIGRKLRRNARRQQGTAATAPDDRPSMSEVLVDVAYPLIAALRLPEHEAEYRFALNLASVLWSVSRVPDNTERQRLLEEILHPKGGPLEPEAFDALVAVYERAWERHPREKRVILGVNVYQETGGRYHIDVASI